MREQHGQEAGVGAKHLEQMRVHGCVFAWRHGAGPGVTASAVLELWACVVGANRLCLHGMMDASW